MSLKHALPCVLILSLRFQWQTPWLLNFPHVFVPKGCTQAARKPHSATIRLPPATAHRRPFLSSLLPQLQAWQRSNRDQEQVVARAAQKRGQGPRAQLDTIAVLLDGDNIGPNHFGPVLKALRKHGSVAAFRVYGTEADLNRMGSTIRQFNATPVSVHRRQRGAKDTTDMRIAFDAAVLAIDPGLLLGPSASHGSRLTIAICSSDLDYLEVFTQVRLLAKGTSGKPRCYMVMTEDQSTLPQLKQAVTDVGAKLIRYSYSQEGARVKAVMNGTTSTIHVEEVRITKMYIAPEQLREACSLLHRLGYMSELEAAEGVPAVKGIAKLFMVNRLGPVVVYPDYCCIHQFVGEMSQKLDVLLANPGHLVYIFPNGAVKGLSKRYGGSQAARVACGGGPFIVADSPDLLGDILLRLRYLDRADDTHYQAAIELFIRHNQNPLSKLGVDVEWLLHESFDGKQQTLREVFVSQVGRQDWRVPPLDFRVRHHLAKEGLLVQANSSKSQVLKAINEYLSRSGISPRYPASYYCGAVASMVKYLNRRDPGLRHHIV